MHNVLIVSGHTDLSHSFANKIILDELKKLLPEAQQHHLDTLHHNYLFDVPAEQEILIAADIIVFQFPLFWYGVPSLMKKWIEDVFVHGFSHGSTGDKVRGKKLIISFTSGAPEEMYQYGGLQSYPIADFLPPLKQFANLCGLVWQEHVYTGNLSYIAKSDEQRAEMRLRAVSHAQKLANNIRNG